jgi:hypothetical protein
MADNITDNQSQSTAETPAATPAPEAHGSERTSAPSDSGTQDNSIGTVADRASTSRKERLAALEAKKAPAAAGNPDTAEPATGAGAANPKPAADTSGKLESIAVKVRDDAGAEKEESFSYEECANAVLRQKGGRKLLNTMSNKMVLEIGSQWLLEQRKQDSYGSRMRDLQKELDAIKSGRAASGPAKAEPAQAAEESTTEATKPPATPATPSTPAAQAVAVEAAQAKWMAEVEGFRQVAGDEVANSLQNLLTRAIGETTAEYLARLQTQETSLKNALAEQAKSYEQRESGLMNLFVEQQFKTLRRDTTDQWPQLKDKANFEKVRKRADSIAKGGEFDNPLEAIEEIWTAACQSVFGNEQEETRAIQLAQQRARQREGQVESGNQRQQSVGQPQSLSRADRMRLMEQKARETGDPAAAKRLASTLASQAG